MRLKEIYLDNGATTKVDPKVVEKMNYYHLEKYGNSSSNHSFGQDAKEALEEARGVIAKSIGCRAEEIVFTSGGTESNNLALKGLAFAQKVAGTGKNHLITTKIEHDCVLESCKWLEKQGFQITYLPVDKDGFVDPEKLRVAISDKTVLVSIIHGNNEIGTIQDLEKLGEVCQEKNVPFHTDACQSYTKTEINVEKQHLSLVTLNAHKIHGPKGVGALYVKKGTKLTPWQHGGGHEFGIRSGTENIPGVIGFVEAVKLASKKHVETMAKLRDKLVNGVLQIEGSRLNGPGIDNSENKRLCNNTNFSFERIEGEALGGYLDQHWICSSTGSACSSKSLEASHVLKAIGLSDEQAHGSLRLTLSRFNTEEEIDYALKMIPKYVEKLRKISPLGRIVQAAKKLAGGGE
tara:strand:+ start:824 stop:2038 length:1215 start_codon:yes stop_codon:yes gene_type:complete